MAQPSGNGAASDENVPDALEIEDHADALPETIAPRCHDLERLAGELADQRAHLIEQYQRLAILHDTWQQQRDSAAAELESLGKRLLDEEQALAERARHAHDTEDKLQERTREIEAMRQDIQFQRSQVQLRDHALAQQHQKETLLLRQHQALLQDQLASLAVLRQRWNSRRQQEIDRLQAERTILANEQKQTQERRLLLFEQGRHVDEERRVLAEKSLALEQYRQQVFRRAKDPTAQRRVERMRRRWLALNSTLIRNAKVAAEGAKKDMAELINVRVELTKAIGRLTHEQAALADQQSALEERDTSLEFRQQELELRLQAAPDVEAVAHGIYQEPETPGIDQAA